MNGHKIYSRGSERGWLRDLISLALFLGIPFFLFLGRLPLIDPDEGRYAEIPREMLERGDLITPTLNYVKYFEKPPLLYWLNAASIKLFGQTEFAARFPSALCGLLTILITYTIARRLYDRRTAQISALILGTSAGFVLQSRIILTDMLLTCLPDGGAGRFHHRRPARRTARQGVSLVYLLPVLRLGGIGQRADRHCFSRLHYLFLPASDQALAAAGGNAPRQRPATVSCNRRPLVPANFDEKSGVCRILFYS